MAKHGWMVMGTATSGRGDEVVFRQQADAAETQADGPGGTGNL